MCRPIASSSPPPHTRQDQWTPLHHAASKGLDGVCGLLIAKNAAVDARDKASRRCRCAIRVPVKQISFRFVRGAHTCPVAAGTHYSDQVEFHERFISHSRYILHHRVSIHFPQDSVHFDEQNRYVDVGFLRRPFIFLGARNVHLDAFLQNKILATICAFNKAMSNYRIDSSDGLFSCPRYLYLRNAQLRRKHKITPRNISMWCLPPIS
jgi:hypothetical protein